MAMIFRIYVEMDDVHGSHSAIYNDVDAATKYFRAIRKKYPKEYVVTETIDDETGKVLRRKEFNKTNQLSIDEVKAHHQEYVSLYRYDIAWKDERLVRQSISPEEASAEMIAAVGQEGFGVEWIYIVKPCALVIFI